MNCRSISNSGLTKSIRRVRTGRFSLVSRALLVAGLWVAFPFSSLFCQQYEEKVIPPERLVYPETQLCVLDPRDLTANDPFDIRDFTLDLMVFLRSEDYLTVKTQAEVKGILARSRAVVPEVYNPEVLARICELTRSDYTVFLRLVSCEIDRGSGFSIPLLFHRNKLTYRAELDMALVEGKTGSLQYSKRLRGQKRLGRGVQVFPVTKDDPNLYLGFRQRERMARLAMQDLAQKTFKALITGMHKPLGVKYACYWQDEVHIISNKAGLCPICGSRLVKLVR